MENNAELVRLEEFVDKLLTKYNQLKSDYHAAERALLALRPTEVRRCR